MEPAEEDYVDVLLERFRDPQEQQRRLAVRALARLGRRAVPALLGVLREEDGPSRRYAAAVFSLTPDPRAIPLLCQALGDVDWEVRREAALALKVSAPPEAAEALLPLLLQEGHPQVRLIAIDALAAIQARDPDTRVSHTVWARVIPSLCTMMASGDWRLQGAAAELLGMLRAVDAVDALWSALGDADLEAALRITVALGKIGTSRAIEPLRVALSHPEPEVRAAAAEALGQVGGEEALMLLAWALRTRDRGLQRSAVLAIEHLAITEPSPALRAVLRPLEKVLMMKYLVLSREDFRLFSRVLHHIDAATRQFRDLPIPALTAAHGAQLPLPAGARSNASPGEPSLLAEAGGLGPRLLRQLVSWRTLF